MVEGNIDYKKWKVPAYLVSMLILFGYFVAMLVAVTVIPLGPFNKPEFLIIGFTSAESDQFTLSNGIKVTIAQLSNQSGGFESAGLSVHVGTVSDPSYFVGRANTYREDVTYNEGLQISLSEGGGHIISSIQREYTAYALMVEPESFESVLEQFVDVLTEDQIYREVEPTVSTVEDVFVKVGDSLLFKQDADIGVGHLNIRKELLQMRDNYYVGENISLILQSSTKTLGELTDLAQIFDTIPNAPKFPLPDKYTILNKSHLNHVAYLVEESHRIEIWWIVSPITDPRTSPHQFFLYLMLYPGQEGPFGVFRKKGWAWHGEYAINTESDQYSILKVKLSLTESGVQNWEVIVGAFYQYIELLKSDDVDVETIWNLFVKSSFAKFQVLERGEFAQQILDNSYNNIKFDHPLSVAFGVALVEEYDSAKFLEVYDHIIPENSLILLSSVGDKFRNRNADGVFFGLEKLTNRKWTSGLDLKLPSSETFIPYKFEQAKCDSFCKEKYVVPRLLVANDQYCLWLWVDSAATSPVVDMYINLLFDNASETDHAYTLRAVYGNHVVLRILDKLDFGPEAGTVISTFYRYSESLTIKASTANELASIVFDTLVEVLKEETISQIDFEIAVEMTRFEFLGYDKDPIDTAYSNYIRYYTNANVLLQNLELIRPDEVAAYGRTIWENNFANMYFTGSIDEKLSMSIASKYTALKESKGGNSAPTHFTRYQVASLNGYLVRQRTVRQDYINQITLFVWNRQGVDSQAKVEVIADLMNINGSFTREDIFLLEELRQTYMNNMGAFDVTFTSDHYYTGYQFLIVSVDLPTELANIDLIERQNYAMDQWYQDLQQISSSIIAKTGSDVPTYYEDEIFTQSYAFDRQERVDAFKLGITRDELLNDFNNLILQKPEASVLQTYPRTIEFFTDWSESSKVVPQIDEWRVAIPDTFKLTNELF